MAPLGDLSHFGLRAAYYRVRGNGSSRHMEDCMQSERDLTASERLQAIAELLARGIDRLAIQKHGRDRAGREDKKRLVQQT